MAEHSVNALLSMQKALIQRRSQLNEIKNESTKKISYFHLENENVQKREEPTYDIKKVDRKIVSINNALFSIDQKIKESNARTMVSIEIDYNSLASEIE